MKQIGTLFIFLFFSIHVGANPVDVFNSKKHSPSSDEDCTYSCELNTGKIMEACMKACEKNTK